MNVIRTGDSHPPPRAISMGVNLLLFLGAVGIASLAGVLAINPSATIDQRLEAGLHERFWQLKVRGRDSAHVVVLGDSRACQDVSPGHLTESFPGEDWRGLNLAFNAAGLSPLVFDLANRRLERDDRSAIVVLGISPPSLTSSNIENTHYRTLESEAPTTAWAYILMPRLMGLVSRRPLPDLVAGSPGRQQYHDDGWLAANPPEDLHSELFLPHFRDFYSSNQVRSPAIEALMAQTERWTSEGVRVIAFRPPASPEMIEIENSLSGFDERAIRREIESRGGHWIEIDASEYTCYDNSHLPREEAVRFSRELGSKITALLSDSPA